MIEREKTKLKILCQLLIRCQRSRSKSRKTNLLKILKERNWKMAITESKSSRAKATSLRQCHRHQQPNRHLSNFNLWMPAKRNAAKTSQRCKFQTSKRFFAHLQTKTTRSLLRLRSQAINLTLINTESTTLGKAVQNKDPNKVNQKVTKAYKQLNVLSHNWS